MIPYSTQTIDNDDINAVVKVLKSDYLTQGPSTVIFEKNLAKYVGSKFCKAVNSATSALILAYKTLDIKKNDIVWTSPISFVATSNAAVILGANIDFVDIDANFNICVDELSNKLYQASLSGKLPKVLTVVHMAGYPADMSKIFSLSKKYKFKIIEDASHALGAEFKGSKVGSCKYSDISVFSFHPVKMITTGEGGALTFNKKMYCNFIELGRSHGITRNKKLFHNQLLKKFSYYYEQLDIGYNFRLTDIQAALGVSQLKKLDKFVKKRNSLAKKYIKSFKNLPIDFQKIDNKNISSYHLFLIFLKDRSTRDRLFCFLKSKNINVNVHYLPIHEQPFYKKLKKFNNLDRACDLSSRVISLPLYPKLLLKDQLLVINLIKGFFQ